MKALTFGIKSILLLFQESKTDDFIENNSRDIIKTLLSIYEKNRKYSHGSDSEIESNIFNMLRQMLEPDHTVYFDKDVLLESISLIVGRERGDLLTLVTNLVNTKQDDSERADYIKNNRLIINKKIKDESIKKKLEKVLFDLKTSETSGINSDILLSNLINDLEEISIKTAKTDEAVNTEIDLSEDSTNAVVQELLENSVEDVKLRVGIQQYNETTQGGHARGTTTTIAALQHNNKSGTLVSFFADTAMFNKASDFATSTKEQMLLLISLEDDTRLALKHLFDYLYYQENSELPDITKYTNKFISDYIASRLTKTGFRIKLIRINPTDWSFKQAFAKISSYEKDFEIVSVFMDYLTLIPTIGCNQNGATGTDYRELLRRFRNFFAKKNISFVTPAQLSSDAKMLTRQDVVDYEFVKHLVDKGYYANSKQLDQEIDLEIFIKLAKIGDTWYQTFQRGKHRGAKFLDTKYRYFMIPFPPGAPFMPDIGKEKSTMFKPKSSSGETMGIEF